jgi:ATP-dependent Clp protease protease subunit
MKEKRLFGNEAVGEKENFVVTVFGAIQSDLAHAVVGRLLTLNARDRREPITLYVMSPGGEVYPGLAIIDTCRIIENPVSTVALGLVASMGAMIFSCAARKGLRLMAPGAELMVHQPSGGAQGTAADIEITARHIAGLRRRLDLMLSEATGLSTRRIRTLSDRDCWLTPGRAVELGFADEVLETTMDADIGKEMER